MPTYKTDKIKMLRSFMPNFIHSLDASNVHLLFKFLFVEYGIIISVYTVHDCFASTVNNIELL
jgi:DNA-directed RNA polymerase